MVLRQTEECMKKMVGDSILKYNPIKEDYTKNTCDSDHNDDAALVTTWEEHDAL